LCARWYQQCKTKLCARWYQQCKTKLCARWYQQCKTSIDGHVTPSVMLIKVAMSQQGGHDVAQLVEATNRKVAGLIRDGVLRIFY